MVSTILLEEQHFNTLAGVSLRGFNSCTEKYQKTRSRNPPRFSKKYLFHVLCQTLWWYLSMAPRSHTWKWRRKTLCLKPPLKWELSLSLLSPGSRYNLTARGFRLVQSARRFASGGGHGRYAICGMTAQKNVLLLPAEKIARNWYHMQPQKREKEREDDDEEFFL